MVIGGKIGFGLAAPAAPAIGTRRFATKYSGHAGAWREFGLPVAAKAGPVADHRVGELLLVGTQRRWKRLRKLEHVLEFRGVRGSSFTRTASAFFQKAQAGPALFPSLP